jgi:hypothetical protein
MRRRNGDAEEECGTREKAREARFDTLRTAEGELEVQEVAFRTPSLASHNPSPQSAASRISLLAPAVPTDPCSADPISP